LLFHLLPRTFPYSPPPSFLSYPLSSLTLIPLLIYLILLLRLSPTIRFATV
jgi:hypothetical protein